nr:hypothetical protein [Rhodococcus sp. ANT_H53B]
MVEDGEGRHSGVGGGGGCELPVSGVGLRRYFFANVLAGFGDQIGDGQAG